jgi:long-chain fatty acid transport protein
MMLVSRFGYASPLFETAGAVGGTGGLNPVVSDPSAASAYFNPAMLIDADENVLIAFTALSEQVSLTLDGRHGGDVPLIVGQRNIVGPDGQPISNTAVPTQWLQKGCPAGSGPGQCPPPGFPARPRQAQGSSGKTRPYLTLGIAKHLIPDRLSVGVYVMVPASSFTTASTFYSDEREALFSNSLHPELYGDRLTAVSLAFGGAFRLLPSLSLGGGFSVGLTNVAASSAYVVNATDYSQLLLNNDVTSKVALSPYLGVYWVPTPRFRVGGALHASESFEIDTGITNTLPSGTQSTSSRSNVYDYMPWRISAGVETDIIQSPAYTMAIVGSAQYEPWSDYIDRQGNSPSIYGADLAWKDTLIWTLGIRHKYHAARAFLDWQYKPSPVPEQVGRSNYVDNDRLGLALGGDIEVKLGPTRLRPGVQFIGYRLIWRHNTKDDSRMVDELPDNSVFASTRDPVPGAAGLQTNNPGWPGFGSEGWVYGATLSIEVLLQ